MMRRELSIHYILYIIYYILYIIYYILYIIYYILYRSLPVRSAKFMDRDEGNGSRDSIFNTDFEESLIVSGGCRSRAGLCQLPVEFIEIMFAGDILRGCRSAFAVRACQNHDDVFIRHVRADSDQGIIGDEIACLFVEDRVVFAVFTG